MITTKRRSLRAYYGKIAAGNMCKKTQDNNKNAIKQYFDAQKNNFFSWFFSDINIDATRQAKWLY